MGSKAWNIKNENLCAEQLCEKKRSFVYLKAGMAAKRNCWGLGGGLIVGANAGHLEKVTYREAAARGGTGTRLGL